MIFLSIPDFFNRRLIHFRVSSSSCLSALSNSASIWAFAKHFAISSSVLKPFLSQKLQKSGQNIGIFETGAKLLKSQKQSNIRLIEIVNNRQISSGQIMKLYSASKCQYTDFFPFFKQIKHLQYSTYSILVVGRFLTRYEWVQWYEFDTGNFFKNHNMSLKMTF